MRNLVKTIVAGMAFLSLAACASGYVPADIAWLVTDMGSGNPTSWPGAGKWQIDGVISEYYWD